MDFLTSLYWAVTRRRRIDRDRAVKRTVADLRKVIDAALAQGWRIERLTTGHLRFVPPDKTKHMVVVGGTPSDFRWLQNTISKLRRSGLVF